MTALFDITGKLAFVTGSSRGIGLALAHGLAGAGARVVLHGRDTGALAAAQEQIEEVTGSRPPVTTFDVTDSTAVAAGIDALIADHGVPDILVNNAGVQRRAPIHEFDPGDWDAVIATNLSAAFYVSRHVAAAMVERGSGKIVNIGSAMSALARQTIAPYGASKAAVAQLSRGMTADLARHNIQVNTISPGYFATEMNTALVEDADFSSWLVERTPARRWGQVTELVGALLFLSSPASDFVSGQNLFVDGGLTSVV